MKILINFNSNEEKIFEFETFNYRLINGTTKDLNENFSLQILNTSKEKLNFEEVVLLYELFDFCKEYMDTISNISIYGKNDKILLNTKALKFKIIDIFFRHSNPDDDIISFVDITLAKENK